MLEVLFPFIFAVFPAFCYWLMYRRGLSQSSATWGYGTGGAIVVSGIFWLCAVSFSGGDMLCPLIIMLSGVAICFCSAKSLS